MEPPSARARRSRSSSMLTVADAGGPPPAVDVAGPGWAEGVPAAVRVGGAAVDWSSFAGRLLEPSAPLADVNASSARESGGGGFPPEELILEEGEGNHSRAAAAGSVGNTFPAMSRPVRRSTRRKPPPRYAKRRRRPLCDIFTADKALDSGPRAGMRSRTAQQVTSSSLTVFTKLLLLLTSPAPPLVELVLAMYPPTHKSERLSQSILTMGVSSKICTSNVMTRVEGLTRRTRPFSVPTATNVSSTVARKGAEEAAFGGGSVDGICTGGAPGSSAAGLSHRALLEALPC
mmetsp:Transcript_18842/g.56914  ORF Transcript_18842/g.56914 Transcript_18842/m.56914 type:complete len:289 (+) Transcript_18842:2286-3152(+)